VVNRRSIGSQRNKTHLRISDSALSPKPFFSVSTISISPYCLF
jgi:hypothetical protein